MLSTIVIGDNPVRFWGIDARERTRRVALANGHRWADGDWADAPALVVNAAFAFDPMWYKHLAAHPGQMLTKGGVPVVAHCETADQGRGVSEAMAADRPADAIPGLEPLAIESGVEIENRELRSRLTPFVDRLVPANIPALERASYFGAYKGVTDILTKYLWPEWALVLTRICARLGISPNQVTAVGFILCCLAMYLFWFGHYWWGMAAGLGFMVLDTVDGKLARCTITSSYWGNVFDHGIDLVHPPFWWWAWAVGLGSWGLGYSSAMFWWVNGSILAGYIVQRLIEGQFILRNGGIHIHVWRRIDSQFRLITARRNPNMVILFVATLLARPDIGLIGVAVWTVLSCVVHLVQLAQAEAIRWRGGTIKSWMEEEA